MDEARLRGGQRQIERIDRALVAVRTPDRRTLISPTKDHPDFFDITLNAERISTENKIIGTISSEYGIVVGNDHALRGVNGEPSTIGWATYLRHTRDYDRAQSFGHFTVHDVKEQYKTLRSVIDDEGSEDELRRESRLKAELFKRVIALFN